MGPKALAACRELVAILDGVLEDGVVDEDETRELYQWRHRHITVVRRQPLKPFTAWLDQALADGEVSPEELDDLRHWCTGIRSWVDADSPPQPESGDAYLDTPKGLRPSWRDDPCTAKQVGFLLDLGATEAQCRGLTKGQANDLINQLLEQRDEGEVVRLSHYQRDTNGRDQLDRPRKGSGCVLLAVVLMTGIVEAVRLLS